MPDTHFSWSGFVRKEPKQVKTPLIEIDHNNEVNEEFAVEQEDAVRDKLLSHRFKTPRNSKLFVHKPSSTVYYERVSLVH